MDKAAEAQAAGQPQDPQQGQVGYQQSPAYAPQAPPVQIQAAPVGYQYPQGQYPAQYPPGQYPGQYPPGQYPAGAVVTVAPQPMVIQEEGPPPNDYLVFSILSIFCFWPLGIAAIIFSVKTREAVKNGDYIKARSHSSIAKIMNIIALVIGIISFVVVVLSQLAWIVPYAIVVSAFRG